MFQGRIIDTKLRKLSIQDAEKFIASSDFGASFFFQELFETKTIIKVSLE
jgi:hypothetical protein